MDAYQQASGGNALYCAIYSGSNARFVIAGRTAENHAFVYSSQQGLYSYSGAWTGAWSVDCPIFSIPASGESPLEQSQGYQPPNWGGPGLKKWTGGTV